MQLVVQASPVSALKRCHADSSCSASSASSSALSSASQPPQPSTAAAVASASVPHQKSDGSASVKCVDGWRGATECRASSSLTMKDLLNDVGSQEDIQDDKAESHDGGGGGGSGGDGELAPRITVEKLEIQAMSEPHPAVAANVEPLPPPQQVSADEALDLKCKRLAELIAGSKHLVAFTGAGISTSVGLPDYRGDNGIRTKGYDKQQQQQQQQQQQLQQSQKRRKVTSSSSAANEAVPLSSSSSSSSDCEGAKQPVIPDFNLLVPSKTHMALYELHRLGYLKHLVSQNVDNLHLKSGVPASALTEVHGNATQAKCETCEKIYTQDFPWTGLCDDPACVSTKRSVEQRLRARTRHGNGRLKRNVISFDEPLGDIDNAIDECEAADVALVLGTSLRVEPFSEMAGEYGESLVIVNLQPTTQKLDRRAETSGVRLFEKCDLVMEKTMKFLLGDEYEIPAWAGEHATSVFMPEHEEKNLVNVLAGRLLS